MRGFELFATAATIQGSTTQQTHSLNPRQGAQALVTTHLCRLMIMHFDTQTAVFLYNMMTVVSGRLTAGAGDETCTVNMHGANQRVRARDRTHPLAQAHINIRTCKQAPNLMRYGRHTCVWVSHDRKLLLVQRLQVQQASLCMVQP